MESRGNFEVFITCPQSFEISQVLNEIREKIGDRVLSLNISLGNEESFVYEFGGMVETCKDVSQVIKGIISGL